MLLLLLLLLLLNGCFTSQQHASVSQGRICSENCTCCHTETEAADQTCSLAKSQYTDTWPTSPRADPVMPGGAGRVATGVLDLTVVDMLLSDHFVISFDPLLRNPVREKRKIISRNIGAIDMHDYRTDVHNLLGSATQSDSTDPLGVFNTCLRQLLDRHAPRVSRTVTDRTSAPWMTLEIKQGKVQRRLAERKHDCFDTYYF